MFSRRSFLNAALGTSAACMAPAIAWGKAEKPVLGHAVASGDVMADGAVIWARADRAAKLYVELDRDADFRNPQRVSGPVGLRENDFNLKMQLRGLAPGTEWHYRLRCESLHTPGAMSVAVTGSFKTAPVQATSNIRFCWSGDTAGQGYGIDPNFGGMLTYRSMLEQKPDFLVHSGDQIYADGPISETVDISEGRVWRNIVTEGKAKVAETTQEFRENFYYNFLDDHYSAFHREVPVYNQWDDHEVVNNWYPGEMLMDDARYTVKSVSLLAERARRAMFECTPIALSVGDRRQIHRKRSYGPLLDMFFLDLRSYRGPNTRNRQPEKSDVTAFLGDDQLNWLKRELKQSKATWKVICSDMPIGLLVTEWQSDVAENGANGDGPPLGRELEIAELLRFIAREDISNVHFITADVHYCASHYYDPAKAQFKDFKPFWEFVSGPLHAGTFGPNKLDNTFGPEVKFLGIPEDMAPGRSPADGYQFFGRVDIDKDTKVMRIAHHNRVGEELWVTELQPEGDT